MLKNQIVWFKGGGGMGDLKGNFLIQLRKFIMFGN